MLDEVMKSFVGLVIESPQEKDRAQEQLQRVLEVRFEPCLELWKELWKFADSRSLENASPNSEHVFSGLSETVDLFMLEWGALISLQCFYDLGRFQMTLRAICRINDGSVKSEKISALKEQLGPWVEKEKSRKKTKSHPGLLLLLRDQLGSNSRAVSSVL